MKHNTSIVTICLMMTLLICLTACDKQFNEQQVVNPPITSTNIEHGQLHNHFLEMMPYSGTPTNDEEVIALATARFSELLSEQNASPEDIENVLRQTNYMVADLLDQGIMHFATDEQHPLPFDSERLAEYLVLHEIVNPRDFNMVLEFIMDIQLPGSSNQKSELGYEDIAQKWNNNQVIPASVLSVMLSSNQFWNVDKKRPSTNAEIVVYDTVGGLLGLFFGPAGSILGAGYCSYVAAIYCTDPSCPDGQNKNLIGNPGPVRDFRDLNKQVSSSIFKRESPQAGFSTGMNTQQKCISVGVVLSLLTLALLRRRFKNEGLGGLGIALFFIPICLMIGTQEFSWVPMIASIVGMMLMLLNLGKTNPNQVSTN